MSFNGSSVKVIAILCDFCVQNGRDHTSRDKRGIALSIPHLDEKSANEKARVLGWRVYPAEKKHRCPLCVRDKIVSEKRDLS